MFTVFPFGDLVDMVKLKGVYLREVFEHSVAKYDPVDKPGAFLQVSGNHFDLQVQYRTRYYLAENESAR